MRIAAVLALACAATLALFGRADEQPMVRTSTVEVACTAALGCPLTVPVTRPSR